MNRTHKSLLPFFLILSFTTFSLTAQDATHIKGSVVDEEGAPLPSANVYWLGTFTHTTTNEEGIFTLPRTEKSSKVIISSMGFRSDTIPISTDIAELKVTLHSLEMEEVEVVAFQRGRSRSKLSAGNQERINMGELLRAACCSLGESFTTNPSVDVSTTDAATGSKQIKLLGLSGKYVQMQTENIPNFRGVSSPFALGYIPGTWIESIQVSKGAASVKNGFESMTGQINVEYRKPNTERYLDGNFYLDQGLRAEGNLIGNYQFGKHWSTALLTHIEDRSLPHDSNKDSFIDMPLQRQYNVMNRWTYKGGHTMLQAGFLYLYENRRSGQLGHLHKSPLDRYQIGIQNHRTEAFTKVAHSFDDENGSNIALILDAGKQKMNSFYGLKTLDIEQNNLYASLIFETQWQGKHALSSGLSWQYDAWHQASQIESRKGLTPHKSTFFESVPGVYTQYTYTPNGHLTLMGGIRADYSNLHGFFVTPRLHVRYSPIEYTNVRFSVGKGYRTQRVLTENYHLLASSRQLIITEGADQLQESSWNFGLSNSWEIPLWKEKKLDLNLEYYYTRFDNRVVMDMDKNPHEVHFYPLNDGLSFSHTFQIDAAYKLLKDLDITAAFRYTDVRTTTNNLLQQEPLSSLFKSMLSLSYKTPLRRWQGDVTLSLNGGGRMPTPYLLADGTSSWKPHFPTYPMLSAQITRFFPKWSIYLGAENMTNFQQPTPIIDAHNPWGPNFDASMVWGPTEGIMVYMGIRFNIFDN